MDFVNIHKKWRKNWAKNGTNKFDPDAKNLDGSPKQKYYALEMFPYPSGANLHLGHFFNFAPADTHARFMRMMGYNVFHPMGFDSFGLPAENHALSTNTHPWDNTLVNMEKFITQLNELGGMYPWEYTLNTCFPDYYRWTQWLFIELFKSGLAYQKESAVNWCGTCKTVIANEQVVGGECERCGNQIEKRKMKQWFLKITNFAEELLSAIPTLDWPEKTKAMQTNWIGKSEGAEVTFTAIISTPAFKEVTENSTDTHIWTGDKTNKITAFTTRVDTLFGVSYIAIAPENDLVPQITTSENKTAVDIYVKDAQSKSDVDRQAGNDKTGVFTGTYAINPINNKKIPVYIADYVLNTYGTGAVMGVPAHDERDYLFATKYNLAINQVITNKQNNAQLPYTEYGTLVNSGEFDGMTTQNAKIAITKKLSDINAGNTKKTFRLRDWSIGRQRYWGVPIPIVYCGKCGTIADERLPVTLPHLDDFKPKGEPPLANSAEFVNTKCPNCGGNAKRETETMDTFMCSSWYFLRYPSVKSQESLEGKNTALAFDPEITEKMLPVDIYVGGAEHATMHLLYARFITKFLKSRGYLSFDEPFKKLVHQGMILARDGSKMSKSKGNTISPDEYVNEHGSDILRLFMLFGFNYIDGGPWNDDTIKSIVRFVNRVEALVIKSVQVENGGTNSGTERPISAELDNIRANTIKSVREDLLNFSFNTAMARCMEFVNAIYKAENTSRDIIYDLVLLTAPLMPHIGEEFHEILGERGSVFDKAFPTYNEKHLAKSEIEIAVQVNSKIRDRITISANMTQDEITAQYSDILGGAAPKKTIYVPGKLINFIV